MNVNLQNFIKYFPNILILIFPLSMVTGPFISEIIMNLLIILFLFKITKKNFFFLITQNFAKIFFVFYFIILLSTLISFIDIKNFSKVLLYIRFLLFSLSVCFFLNHNKKLFKNYYFVLAFILVVVSIDGIFQYYNGKNFFGFIQYRPDRVSGFFNDDLILGSYLSKFLPLLLALYYFNNKETNFKSNFFILTFLITIIFTIFISGERSSLLFAIVFFTFLIFVIKIKFSHKLISFLSVVLIIVITLFSNQTLLNRYINQTITHTFGNKSFGSQIFPEHNPLIVTAIKMFNDKKLLGHGIRSFRYKCSDQKYITFGEKFTIIDNESLTFDVSWKYLNVEVVKIFIRENDIISSGDKVFEYVVKKGNDKGKKFIFRSNKNGKVKKIKFKEGSRFGSNVYLVDLKIIDENIPAKQKIKRMGCDTHPHNYYFQIIAETGLLGLMVFIFIYFSLIRKVFNIFKMNFFKKKLNINNSEIVMIAFLLSYFWPLTFTGNFFNNWLSMSLFYSIGYYLYFKIYDKKTSHK